MVLECIRVERPDSCACEPIDDVVGCASCRPCDLHYARDVIDAYSSSGISSKPNITLGRIGTLEWLEYTRIQWHKFVSCVRRQ